MYTGSTGCSLMKKGKTICSGAPGTILQSAHLREKDKSNIGERLAKKTRVTRAAPFDIYPVIIHFAKLVGAIRYTIEKD